jgi:glutamate racemase
VPAIKPACARSKTRRVSVLGTKGTVKREYTKALIRDFAQGCEVTLVGSPELASLAERELSGHPISDNEILAELAPCFVGNADDAGARTDIVVLACTHYPLLLDRFERLAPWPVEWIDPAPAIARRVSDLLGPRTADVGQSAEMIFTSNRVHGLGATLTPFFGGRAVA